MNKNIFPCLLSLVICIISSCRKDGPEEVVKPTVPAAGKEVVYIVNEGNFGSANSKISYYDITNASVTEDVYFPANNTSAGDVCQSMCFFNSKAYIVVNNSQKIIVADPLSFVKTATIAGFTSPRYFLPVSNSKAYVTDLYSNSISVVNLSSNSIVGNIPCKGWTEKLVLAYGKAYVTNETSDKVYVINTLTDVITDSIQLAYGSNSIVEDKNSKLWVICGGKQSANLYAALYCIDPLTNKVEKSFQFPSLSDSPWKLCINEIKDTLYFLNKGIFQMPVTSGSLPASPLITEGSKSFYGIGIEPGSGNIYVADAIDYVQKGRVYRYKSNGSLINSFLAGIVPAEFYFR